MGSIRCTLLYSINIALIILFNLLNLGIFLYFIGEKQNLTIGKLILLILIGWLFIKAEKGFVKNRDLRPFALIVMIFIELAYLWVYYPI